MSLLTTALETKQETVHDWSMHTSSEWLWFGIIGVLGAAVVWFIIRDRNSIATQLERLNTKFDELMAHMLSHYATKEELTKVEKVLHRHLEQSTLRTVERRSIQDGEGK